VGIARWFVALGTFEVVVEATASYEWLVKLVEPLAHRVLSAHPTKLRVIAESKRKSDKLDAQVLAEFLASDEISLAYGPPSSASWDEIKIIAEGWLNSSQFGWAPLGLSPCLMPIP